MNVSSKTSMQNKVLSLFLALAMVLGLLPLTDFAYAGSSNNRAIQIGTSAIESPAKHTVSEGIYYTPRSYIYFGYYQGAGIKWRVLDAYKDNNGNADRMFLMSEEEKESIQFKINNANDTYQGSDAQSWCKSFAENRSYFSANEYNTMVGVAKTDSANNLYIGSKTEYSGLSWGTSELKTTDKMFFMSVKELSDYVANYDSATDLRSGNWWLRTPLTVSGNYNAGAVLNDNDYYTGVNAIGVYSNIPARPAFNLDKSQVLFASAANSGKPTSTVNGSLTNIGYYDGNEWKLTLKDTNRSLSVTESEATGVAGGSISLHFSGATYTEQSNNEYISAMLVDSNNNVLYYGRVKKLTSNGGSVSITIPDGLDAGDYTLKLFNEQYNGDYRTDYASDFKDVSLTVTTPKEAKIGDVSYDKLEEALTAASSNTTADTIEIITDSVTEVEDAALKAGDSIKKVYTSQWGDQTYTYTYQLEATTDATLSVNSDDGYICFGFTGGEVNVVSGEALFSNGAVATGKTGKKITVTAGSAWVEAGDEDDATDYVDVSPSGKVKIGDAVYENADTSSVGGTSMRIEVTATGNTLTGGSVNLDKNGEIYLDVYDEEDKNISTLIKNTGDKAIIVTANNSSYSWDNTVTVPAGGKVKIGSKEYEAGEAAATFIVYDEDKVTLASGEVKLDKTEKILVSYANVPVINQGDTTVNVTANNTDGTGKAVIPQGGTAKINNKEISVLEGSASVGIGTNGELTVTINPGKVKIGNMTYTGDVLLNIDSNGNVSQSKGNVIIDEKALEDSNFSYELLAGQSATIGKYTYTAPATGSKGDVTIISRGQSTNPAVILKNANDTVDISLTDNADTKTTYTAVNEKTKFAIVDWDPDTTKNILLLSNELTANSKIKVPAGVTVYSNISPITSAANDTVIGLDSSLNANLESGVAMTAGSMKAQIGDDTMSFASDGNKYTVDTANATITLNENGTVAMGNNENQVKFVGKTADTFTLARENNKLTAIIPADAIIIGKGTTVKGVAKAEDGKDTKVEINEETGELTLLEGAAIATIANEGDKFAMSDRTYTTAAANTTFSVDSEGNAQLISGGVKLNDGKSIIGAKCKLITNPADSSEDTLVVTVEDGNDVITIPAKDGKVQIANTEYVAAADNTKIVVDDNGNNLISGGALLDDGKSIIGIRGKLITNPADSSEDILIVTVEDGNDVITIPGKGGKLNIAGTEYDAAADNTKIVVGDKGYTLSEGAVQLDDGESIIGTNGKLITNPAKSGDDKIIITVDGDKDIIEVPANGKVEIGGVLYTAGTKGVTLVVGADGKISVTAGSLKTVKTGDNSNLALWIALLLISCGAFMGTTAINKKRRYDNN